MDNKIIKLKNDIELFYRRNANTPRIALCFNLSMNELIAKSGAASLMARLLLQGTKNRSSLQLAEDLDKYGIELSIEFKSDYLRLKFICLNEDFEAALEILEDIIKNSTFEEFDKERVKLFGEIEAQLDSPRVKVIDNYYRNIYEGHHYGNTGTLLLENLQNLTMKDVINTYNIFKNNSKKIVAVVGDLDFDSVNSLLEKHFGDLPLSVEEVKPLESPVLNEKKELEIIKPDANQAHIIQGWLVDVVNGDDYPSLALLNVILGSSGLSSRLFLELRDKKGLAYVVRSSYDALKLAATFLIYIATEPKNIEVSLAGFKEEIDKIKTVLVSCEELENAKNNLFGKWAFSMEDNNRQASCYAHYGIVGLGFDFLERAKERINSVTPEDIMACANKYFNDKYVISVIKP